MTAGITGKVHSVGATPEIEQCQKLIRASLLTDRLAANKQKKAARQSSCRAAFAFHVLEQAPDRGLAATVAYLSERSGR
ncbi:hypothetical protein C2E31_04275 [Rhodopirellula baltica]|nr:hypothetical protein C2E31_04275 [Rhodopirellula baltica]